ncbi:MAG: HD domain-containing protein [Desulfobacterales bacterium]|nr:HD domain-containing protein [Desulfobacterales bacterium]
MNSSKINYSTNKGLNSLLKNVISDIKEYAEHQITHIKKRAEIGIALSVEKDLNKLLEMIVDEARGLLNADAGTLYRLDKDEKYLCFEIVQNESLGIRMGGKSGKKLELPSVPLYVDGDPNYSNVSSYAALTGKIINIPDVYKAKEFDFTGPKKYDEKTGYKSTSMLVIPMKNHEDNIIGVLQFINAIDPETREIIPFSEEYVEEAASLASQAAISLTNTQLIQDLKSLFDSFIRSIATAIDAKSPYTKGHIDRVVELTMLIAEKINETKEAPFNNITFTQDEMEELRIAAWMHDIGKITTPEYVVDKSTKLETIFDRIHIVHTRFALIEKITETEYLNKKLELIQKGKLTDSDIKTIDNELSEKLKILRDNAELITLCNKPSEFINDDKLNQLKEIANKKFYLNGVEYPFLSENELKNICIRKGSLTNEEREVIENHVVMTLKMTEQLPFPKKLSKVPEFASGHHEKLDGSGYPKKLKKEQLSIQARIMAIADIFEALTAKDRPYKKPMKLSEAIKILGFMKKDKHIDPDIYELFIKEKLYLKYAETQLNKEQIDIDGL